MTDPGADLRRVAQRIDALPTVARRSPGGVVQVATYLPGDRLVGVREVDGRLHVHVVLASGATVPDLRREVHEALADQWSPDEIHIAIDDIDVVSPGRRPATSTNPT